MNHEERLQYIWKKRLIPESSLKTACGLDVEVIHPGEKNPNAGPDFFNARIKLGNLIWAGNVEVHHRASHWSHHRHNLDPAYDNVILHVIHDLDEQTKNSQDRLIPALVVDPADVKIQLPEDLSNCVPRIPCQSLISRVPIDSLESWFDALYMERLGHKVGYASHLLSRYPRSREKAQLLVLAAGFGLPINSLPFELLVSGIPLTLLLELKESLLHLEALLFGHSGLLMKTKREEAYPSCLQKIYDPLKKEVPWKPVAPHLWKFLRIRPASFPTLRMAQFASFVHGYFPLDDQMMKFESIGEIEQRLNQEASKYWNTHYLFGRQSPHSLKRMGKQAIQNLVINMIVPYLVAMGRADRGLSLECYGKEMLLKMNPESNQIVKNWIKFGLKPRNAFESQALIHLYNGYCVRKQCHQCQLGKIVRGKN